jgi:hypothetical protein
MKKHAVHRRKKVMFIVLGGLLVCIGSILIWFHIPYSPLKQQCTRDVAELISDSTELTNEVFTESEFENLPPIIQKYISYCGYIGTRKMSFMRAEYKDVNFMQSRSGPALRIDYTQYNFTGVPSRLAFIDSSMFGIPFEGYDYYFNGKGGMKGIIGKAIQLFNQTGQEMDEACLVTYLSECLFVPSSLLQGYIALEEINRLQIRATIEYYGISVSGIFTFNDEGEMTSFVTDNRAVSNTDGTYEYVRWSAVCEDYQLSGNGIKYPAKFQAVWNFPGEDFVYFDGKFSMISYDE